MSVSYTHLDVYKRQELRKGFDLVLAPRMKAKTASFREIADELQQLLVKGNIIETVARDGEKSDLAQKSKG